MTDWTKSSDHKPGDQSGVEVQRTLGCRVSPGCVHPDHDDELILIRDAQHPGQHALRFLAAEWEAFTEAVKRGEFDLRPTPTEQRAGQR